MLDRVGMPVVQAINICGQILPAGRATWLTSRLTGECGRVAGTAPQGDVPDAPAVQFAATGNPGESAGTDDGEGKPGPVRLVSNAVPGKPDGEVDTRP